MTEQNNVRPGTNPRMWQGRIIENDMSITGPVGGVVSRYGSPENEDSESYEGRPGTYGPVYDKLPSVEQMRREVETGEFSPESIAIAQDILKDAKADEKPARDPENDDWFADAIDDDWWAQQEYFGAPREKSFIEKQTDDIMKRVTKAPLPTAAHFKKIGTEAKKTTKHFKNFAKHLPAKPEPGANLKYRPFLILSTIRDEL